MAERETPTPTPPEDGSAAEPAADVVASDAAAVESTGREKLGRRRWLIIWLAVGLGVALMIALLLPVVSMLQPNYYRRYSSMGPRMDHWRTSTHSRISCAECHINPGPAAFLTFAAESVPAFYSQLFQGPKTTNLLKPPNKQACQKCHTTYRRVSPAGDLLIPHRAHVEVLGMECVVCHKDLVHTNNRRGFNRPEMETCLQCHNGDKASNKCTDCHTRKQTPASHARKDWLSIHGELSESQDCAKCHDWTPDYCNACHTKRPSSHAGNWKTNHAAAAKKRGEGCLVCHEEAFCKRCH